MSEGAPIVADATVTMGATHYQVEIATGGHHLAADEPKHEGGGDAGPSPFGLLLASLGACTAITLRMYAERKQWTLRAITVTLARFGALGLGMAQQQQTTHGRSSLPDSLVPAS